MAGKTNGRKPGGKTKKTEAVDPALPIGGEDDPLGGEQAEEPQRLSPVEGDARNSYPSQAETLGIIPRSGGHDLATPLFEGDADFSKWAVRGNRTERMALSMVAINAENDALTSNSYPVRSDQMAEILGERSVYQSVFAVKDKTEMSKIEFGGIIALLLGIFGFLVLIGFVFAP